MAPLVRFCLQEARLYCSTMTDPPQSLPAEAPAGQVGSTHAPGDVRRMPPSGERLDEQSHHYLLLTPTPPDLVAIACYGSTQATEALEGACAAIVEIAPGGAGPVLVRTPADIPSPLRACRPVGAPPTHAFWYPAILLGHPADRLPTRERREADALHAARGVLDDALGVGPGGTARHPGSWRGRIVRLVPRVAESLQSPLAVIVTAHAYSARRRYQTVVPLYGRPLRPGVRGLALDGEAAWAPFVLDHVARDVAPARRRLIAGLGRARAVEGQALRNCQIAADTGYALSTPVVDEIARALVGHLSR